MAEMYPTIGVEVTGRRTFDITNGWNGRHPSDVPVIVVTHEVPKAWVEEFVDGQGAPFTFVTDGVERAVELAKKVAGDRNVAVGAASLVQQCLKLGLLDEIQIDLAPVLLGDGVRLFDGLGGAPTELERTRIIETPDVTHITFRVVKSKQEKP
jgi:dihydrofolate reductase